MASEYLTLGEAADALTRSTSHPTHDWQIRRLYERGLLPPAERIGRNRVVRRRDLPKVLEALRAAGYVPAEAVPA